MTDTVGTNNLITGDGTTVAAAVNLTIINGVTVETPFFAEWVNGGAKTTANPDPVFDAQNFINSGSVANNTGQMLAVENAINTKLATIMNYDSSIALSNGTVAVNTGSVAVNTASMVAELGTIAALLTGTLSVNGGGSASAPYNLGALAVTKLVIPGQAYTVAAAGTVTRGGWVRVTDPAGAFVNQITAATLVEGGPNVFNNGGVVYEIAPSALAVSMISSGTSVVVSGLLFT